MPANHTPHSYPSNYARSPQNVTVTDVAFVTDVAEEARDDDEDDDEETVGYISAVEHIGRSFR